MLNILKSHADGKNCENFIFYKNVDLKNVIVKKNCQNVHRENECRH